MRAISKAPIYVQLTAVAAAVVTTTTATSRQLQAYARAGTSAMPVSLQASASVLDLLSLDSILTPTRQSDNWLESTQVSY